MGRKIKIYTNKFKTKIVLEILREEDSLSVIGSRYSIATSTLSCWKEQFLKNADIVFNSDKSSKELKEKLKEAKKKEEKLYNQIGKLTTQVEWAKFCLMY